MIFDCDDDPDRPGWGDIYAPELMERVGGVTTVEGWAMDYDRVENIEVWIDGEFIDFVDEQFLPTPEVEDLFPWLPRFMTENAGFRYDLDTVGLNLADGEHGLVIRATDRWGGATVIGERRFVIDNPGVTAPGSTRRIALD